VLDSAAGKSLEGACERTNMSRGTVPVVDDEPEVRRPLREFLADRGYDVLVAAGAQEALALLKTRGPDLGLLDIAMPGMDGVEALRRIATGYPVVPVIVVTTNTDISVTSKLLAMGAVDYIPTPFDLEYLDQAVSIQLAASRDP
jgi:CheY-like chemotaxis protein